MRVEDASQFLLPSQIVSLKHLTELASWDKNVVYLERDKATCNVGTSLYHEQWSDER